MSKPLADLVEQVDTITDQVTSLPLLDDGLIAIRGADEGHLRSLGDAAERLAAAVRSKFENLYSI